MPLHNSIDLTYTSDRINDMEIEKIKKALTESAKVKMMMADTMAERIGEVAEALAATIRSGGKAIFCGNGGSAADSQHLATELVVRLSGNNNRKALAAIALTTNSSILTACANDFGFDEIFARQIEALGAPGDILFAISTSGNSENVIRATKAAKRIGLVTVVAAANWRAWLTTHLLSHPMIPSEFRRGISPWAI